MEEDRGGWRRIEADGGGQRRIEEDRGGGGGGGGGDDYHDDDDDDDDDELQQDFIQFLVKTSISQAAPTLYIGDGWVHIFKIPHSKSLMDETCGSNDTLALTIQISILNH